MDRKQPCNLCGECDFEALAERDRLGQPLATVVCRCCGLVSHAHIPTRAELQHYYETTYRRDYHGASKPAPYRVLRAWRRGRTLLDRLRPSVPSGARVLEVGSGVGGTIMNFALAGYDARGIEPGEDFAAYSRESLRANVQLGTLEDLPPVARYDFVLLVHVLEHLPSPTDALMRIGQLLAPGGRAYVEVPNFAGPHAAPGKQFHVAHIYNFTPATLRMLAAKSGFRVARAFTSPHDKSIALLLEKDAGASFQLERASYAKTLEALRRFSRLSYYMRAGYLLRGALTHVNRLAERVVARRQVAQILARCESYAATRPIATVPMRRVA